MRSRSRICFNAIVIGERVNFGDAALNVPSEIRTFDVR